MVRPRQSSKLLHSRKRQKRTQRKRFIGYALIALVLVVVGIGGYAYRTMGRAMLDPETGCPQDGGISLTVIVIDKSDPISSRQQAFLRNHLEAIKEKIPSGGRLHVYEFGRDVESLLNPLISVCNPGRGRDIDPWTGSQRRVEKMWQEGFEQRVHAVFNSMLDPDQTDWSPILESIQSIGITALNHPDWQGKPRRLIVVSDLLQYTPEFSHYQGPGSFETFSRTAYYHRVRTSLLGVDVTVYYLPRVTQRSVQGPGHLNFWKDVFLDQGARPGRPAFFVHVEG